MNRDFHKFIYLIQVIKQQWAKKENFKKLQWDLLKTTLRQAYYNIEFYKKRFDDAGINVEKLRNPDELKKIPILSKEEVREEFKSQNIFNKKYLNDCINRTTSGSSGFPLTVYYDKKSYAYSEAIYARALFEEGVRLRDVIAYFWYEPFKERGLWEYLGLFRKNEVLYTEDENRQVDRLIKLNPTVIHSFPSALFVLCQIIKRRKIELNPKLIITHGELLLDPVRNEIKKTFDAPVLDQYGSNEFNRMAWQCREYENYHIDADNIFIEFLDEKNQEVKPGEKGRLIITHLFNRMMPLIRYDIGDYAVKSDKECPCGRNLPILERIDGRKDDFIFLEGGRFISPRKLGGVLEKVESFDWYHFIQTGIGRFKLEIIPNDKYNESECRYIYKILKNVLEDKSDLEIIIVDQLSRTRTGKMRAIESVIKKDDLIRGS